MNNNYLKANKIRMNLLLFIDKEMRNKIPNVSEFNNYNYEIQFEEIFSSDGKILKYDNLTENSSNKENQSKNIVKKITNDNQNFNVSFKDIKYKYQSNKKCSSTMLFINTEKTFKNNSKEYLKCLCNNLLILRKKPSKPVISFRSSTKKKQKIFSSKKTNKDFRIRTCNKRVIPESSILVTAFKY